MIETKILEESNIEMFPGLRSSVGKHENDISSISDTGDFEEKVIRDFLTEVEVLIAPLPLSKRGLVV